MYSILKKIYMDWKLVTYRSFQILIGAKFKFWRENGRAEYTWSGEQLAAVSLVQASHHTYLYRQSYVSHYFKISFFHTQIC